MDSKSKKIKEDFIRLINSNQLFHAYIFFGQDLEKIKSFAASLAQFLETGNFENRNLLSDFCAISKNATENIGIDDVRRGQDFLFRVPVVSKYRYLVIENAELLTPEAQNCLLKTLEEPPKNSFIVLITKSTESLLPTIVSRVQKIHFSKSQKKRNIEENSDEFIAKADSIVIDLSKDLRHNSKTASIVLKRLSEMKKYNLNNKLQIRYLEAECKMQISKYKM